jgi:hypothetical protein
MSDFEQMDPDDPESVIEFMEGGWKQDFELLVLSKLLLQEAVGYLNDEWFKTVHYDRMVEFFTLFNALHPEAMSEDGDNVMCKSVDGEWVTMEEHLDRVRYLFED